MSTSRLAPIVRAFAEQALTLPQEKLVELCDSAITLVRRKGGNLTQFRKLVRLELKKIDPVREAAIVTAQGDAGSLTSALTALSKHVHTTTTVNAKLLGGAVVRIGDMRIDNSVRGQLSRAARQLLQNITPTTL